MKIFVSSTYHDLRQHRRVVLDTLLTLRAGIEVLAMEYFGGNPSDTVTVSREFVSNADLYLGVFGWRYGSIDRQTKMSVTEVEYRTALALQIPTYLYLIAEDQAVPPDAFDTGTGARRIRRLKAEIQGRHTVQFFTSPEDLGRRVAIDVAAHLRALQSPHPRPLQCLDGPVDEHINAAHPYIFLHAAAPSPIEGLYDVRLFIDVYENDGSRYAGALAAVDRVVYQLHRTFVIPVVPMQNWRQRFALDTRVWGEFWAQATLYFADGAKSPISLQRYIRLPLRDESRPEAPWIETLAWGEDRQNNDETEE